MPKISQLTAASALDGTETLPLVQGGATRAATAAQVAGAVPVTATGATAAIAHADRFARQYFASDFGAKCDVRALVDVAVTVGSNIALSASVTATDNGKTVVIKSVGTNATQTIGNNGTISRNITAVVPGVSFVFDGAAPTYTVAATTAYIGGTDDTAAVNAAILKVYKQGGGKVLLNGATVASQIVLYRNVCLAGAYEGGTILLQKTGSNKDFIVTENFAALVGNNIRYGDDARVPSWFGLKDLVIDCQSTQDGRTVGNTSGRGVCLYGSAPYMDNVIVTNAAGDGIFTEGPSSNVFGLYDIRAIEEGCFGRVEARENGGNGWTFHGQNDSRLSQIVTSGNGGWNFYSDADFASGFHYNGSCYIDNLHSYFSKTGTGVRFGSCVQVGNLYIDYCNLQFDTYSFGSIVGSVFFIGAGYQGLDPCIFNGSNVTIGSITGTVASTSAAGMRFLNLGAQNNIIIDNALIDLSGTTASATGVYSRGSLNRVTASVRSNGTAAKTGMDIGGNYQVMNLLADDVVTGIAYTTGNNNDMTVIANQTGTHTAFGGNIASTDKVYASSPTSPGSHGFLFGSIFQVQTFPGSEKLVMGNSVRVPLRTVTAAGVVTVAPNADYKIVVNKTVGAATTVNLPTFPIAGDEYVVIDGKRDAAANNITLTPTGGQTINNVATLAMGVNGAWGFVSFDGVQWQAKVT